MKIKHKIVLAAGALISVLLLIQAGISQIMIRKELKSNAIERLDSEVENKGRALKELMQRTHEDLYTLTAHEGLEDYFSSRKIGDKEGMLHAENDLEAFFVGITLAKPQYSKILLATSDFSPVIHVAGGKRIKSFSPDDYDLAEVRQMLNHLNDEQKEHMIDHKMIHEVYMDKKEGLMLVFGSFLDVHGEKEGFVLVYYPIENNIKQLFSDESTTGIHYVVIDETDNLVAGSSNINKEILAGLVNEKLSDWLVSSERIPDLGIKVIMGIQKTEAFAVINNLFIIGIIVLILAVLFSILFLGIIARNISNPINDLVEWAGRLSKGDLTQQDYKTSNDEIGELNRSYRDVVTSFREVASVCESISRGDFDKSLDIKSEKDVLGISVNRMITDLKETTVSRDYFDNIIKSMLDAVLIIDEKNEIKSVNQAAIEMVHYSEEDLVGKAVNIILPEIESCHETIKHMKAEGYIVNRETEFKTKKNKIIPVILSVSEIKNRDGSLERIISAKDITRLKQAEASLKLNHIELERKNSDLDNNRIQLQSAVDEIHSLLQNVIWNDDFNVGLHNPDLKKCYETLNCRNDACSCHGIEPVRCWQVVGTFCGGKITGDFTAKQEDCMKCIVFQEATVDPVYRIREHFNNMMHVIEIKNRELENAYKEISYTQVKVVQQEKMATIGQLAAGVAHEINNPTGFISSNLGTLGNYMNKLTKFINAQNTTLELVKAEEPLENLKEMRRKMKIDYVLNDVGELISESLDGAHRIKNIVKNLKTFARIDEKEYKQANINECIESTLNIVWNELKYKVTVEKEYGEIPLTKCYPQQLNQVIMNLLVNAGQAIEKRGEIKIKTWKVDDYINVSISDSGSGIPEDKLEKIFEPFFTTKEAGKGTGLGLSISHEIVQKHNGEFLVESEVGKGTTFCIKIPIVQEDSNDRQTESEAVNRNAVVKEVVTSEK